MIERMFNNKLTITGMLLPLALPLPVQAHSFGQIYTLPIPFWLYVWAAAATLVASFVVVGIFASASGGTSKIAATRTYPHEMPRWLLRLLRGLSVLGLLSCIVTGFLGTPSPYGNFNMTFFWIVFVLGYAYTTALVGDLYALINPWRVMVEAAQRLLPALTKGRWAYPSRWGYTPALLLYMGFIWLELMGRTGPWSLAMALTLYTALNLIAVAAIGVRDWFRYGEFFSVFMRLIARMAPVAWEAGEDETGQPSRRFRWRWPFAGLLDARDHHPSLVFFILFMLSSTAFDGLHEAKPWVELYWDVFFRHVLSHWVGDNAFAAFPQLMQWYPWWQGFWLLLSPLLYWLLYMTGMWLVRFAGGSPIPLRELALRYAASLLPIVLVYHITHYYTLIQTQGIKIIALLSDPLGRGDNWFGTAAWFRGLNVPDMDIVWHVQVGLIVLGHVISVYIAHVEALRCYGSRGRAALSQIPMLALMVLFTMAGLWILAQPIKAV